MKDTDQAPKAGGASQPSGETTADRTGFPWKVAGGGALALLLIWFVVQNSHSVQVNLFWWSGTFPMILLIAAVAVAAIVVWETLALLRRRRRKRTAAER